MTQGQYSITNNHNMRMLSICSVAFVIIMTLVIGIGFVRSTNKAEAKAIERVLADDRTTDDDASSIAQIVQRMRSIDMTGCPKEFRKVYLDHINAWEQMAAVEQESIAWDNRYDSGGTWVEAILRGLMFDYGMFGEADAARNRVLEMKRNASANVYATYTVVQQIAIDHGAKALEGE